MPERKTAERLQTNLLQHPAIRAWRSLGHQRVKPLYIEILKKKHGKKCSAYRLAGVGPDNCAVIAKGCPPERAFLERTVYEEILPQLSVRTAHYYGSVEGPAGYWWIFLEDVGDQRYSPLSSEHRALAAHWLGAMHTSAENISPITSLPDRGPDYHQMYLQYLREMIPEIRTISRLNARSRAVLKEILSLCDHLDGQWRDIESYCEPLPRTFVHGDCVVKNAHVQATANGSTFALFDWGSAGWGLPATDLGQLGLPYHSVPQSDPDYQTYAITVGQQWPNLDVTTVRRLAYLGQIFWSLKVIGLSLPGFNDERTHLESLTYNFVIYADVLANAINAIR